MTQPDWDDERLDAAFHARFDRTAPTTVAHDVHVRIAGTSPARFSLPRVGQPWSLAAAAVVVILIGTAIYLPAALSLPGASPVPSAGATSAPSPDATPTEQALPGSVFGLPIIHVSDAIAVRDTGVDDREIAVQGWFEDGLISCPAPLVAPVSPVQLECPDGFVWLMERPESLIHRSGNQTDMGSPTGPALNPDMDGLDPVPGPEVAANGDTVPTDVVFVGHFDDRRAAFCPRDEIDACRDRFVVDSVARVHGASTTSDHVSPLIATTQSSATEIEAVVANETPDSPVLSVTDEAGPTGLAAIEPSLGTGQQGLIDQPVLWIARVLESERVVTYIVIDGSDAIYEMNPAGEPILVGGTPPSPGTSPSAGQWPPAGALVLDLPGIDIGKPPVRVAIVDESGRFVSAIEQTPVTFSPDGRFGATAEPGKSGQVHLAWVGGVCDSQVTITVGADLRSIGFDMGPQPDCDSMGVEHELVMNFTGTVDVPAIHVGEETAIATPTGSTAFDLECLSFAPDDCQQRADQIIAATPSQRVVAIKIVDRCGSYSVTFSDGTSTNAIVDCVLGTGAAPSPQASGAS